VFQKADLAVMRVMRRISYVSGVCLVGIMFVAFFNVLGEKLFKSGIPMSTELIQYLHIPVVFLACGFVTLSAGQIKIDLLSSRLPPALGFAFSLLGDALGIFICAFIAARGFAQTEKFIERHSMSNISGMGFPLWPFGVLFSLGFALFAFSFFWSVCRKCSRLKEKG
jgi:TRAP-type C4-dicarboxylate transport system permease small subunit